MDTRISVHDRGPYPELDPYRGKVSEDEISAIYEQEQMAFWYTAQTLAQEHGFEGVYQEGRSGGWAEPYPQRYEEGDDGYRDEVDRIGALCRDLCAEKDFHRSEFLRRVAAVADVVGVYE